MYRENEIYNEINLFMSHIIITFAPRKRHQIWKRKV